LVVPLFFCILVLLMRDMMTREEIGKIMSDEELLQMGMTREEWIESFLEEENYINNWAKRTTLN
jgi:hypothetical protein